MSSWRATAVGRGEYKYFTYPLPDIVADLRRAIYQFWRRSPIAGTRRWGSMSATLTRTPISSRAATRRGRRGQRRSSLQYAAGDYNALHQDLYGEHVFPLQLTILLSEPERDFTGGEFVLTEQRPRMQSRAEVVPLRRGDAVVFAVHHRPVHGTRGTYRVTLRHGVAAAIRPSPHRGRDLSRREMTRDLFEDDVRTSGSRRARCCWGGFARRFEAPCVTALRRVVEVAPFRHMVTPGGHRMSVAITNCGALGWVTDQSGYRYDSHDPQTGCRWPPCPTCSRPRGPGGGAGGFDGFAPDACLINRYEPGGEIVAASGQERA